MAVKTYTLSELKQLVLGSINSIKNLQAQFQVEDSYKAYDTAVRECGFELPTDTTDSDYGLRVQWLIDRMKRWFLAELMRRHPTIFDVGEVRGSQIFKQLNKLVTDMDAQFAEARASERTAHIFVDAGDVFDLDTGHIKKPGFKQDALGQEVTSE